MKAKDREFIKYTVLGALLGFAVTEALRAIVAKKRWDDNKMNTP